MWDIYDDLIDSIPDNLTVQDCMLGLHWTLVKSEGGTGTAMTVNGGQENSDEYRELVGMPLKELAGYVKSWTFPNASLGMAAINSALNTTQQVSVLTNPTFQITENSEEDNAFSTFMPYIKDKKVAVIGHFPNIEELGEFCQLSILERMPQKGDYPDPACEYLLPEQEVVFITGSAFINKTMPRLLTLAKDSQIILVGPSVPISPVLFDYGVDVISSTVILNEELIWRVVKQGGKMKIFKMGAQMISIKQPGYYSQGDEQS
ncbi:MAG: Rossmann-like domain-containing protein [Syntrophomonadaceae bacterium]|jgi:uncharacterized protein (DUF4213/DUF364 family)